MHAPMVSAAPIKVFLMPMLRISEFLSASNCLIAASASMSLMPFAVRKSRTKEDGSPQIILALASEMRSAGFIYCHLTGGPGANGSGIRSAPNRQPQQGSEQTVMGPYYPTGEYLPDRAAFEARGCPAS